jgi:hypothetical protein
MTPTLPELAGIAIEGKADAYESWLFSERPVVTFARKSCSKTTAGSFA